MWIGIKSLSFELPLSLLQATIMGDNNKRIHVQHDWKIMLANEAIHNVSAIYCTFSFCEMEQKLQISWIWAEMLTIHT